jgi:hypothetical protein
MRRFNNQTWQFSTRIFLIKFEEKLDRRAIFHVQKEIFNFCFPWKNGISGSVESLTHLQVQWTIPYQIICTCEIDHVQQKLYSSI